MFQLFNKNNIGEPDRKNHRYTPSWLKHNDMFAQPTEERQGCLIASIRWGAYFNGYTTDERKGYSLDNAKYPKPEDEGAWKYGNFHRGFR